MVLLVLVLVVFRAPDTPCGGDACACGGDACACGGVACAGVAAAFASSGGAAHAGDVAAWACIQYNFVVCTVESYVFFGGLEYSESLQGDGAEDRIRRTWMTP